MAILFNIETLERETKCNPEYMLVALQHYYNGKTVPSNVYEKYKPIKTSLKGSSFLVNPKALFDDKTTDIIYKAQYLRLAGRRDYLLFRHYGIKYLDLTFLPEISIDSIKLNPLLTINKNIVTFKYEENK